MFVSLSEDPIRVVGASSVEVLPLFATSVAKVINLLRSRTSKITPGVLACTDTTVEVVCISAPFGTL